MCACSGQRGDEDVLEFVTSWKKHHQNLYEFLLFNIMSNVATITNFLMLAVGTRLFFRKLAAIPFHWLIFDYPVKESGDGGLCGFLSFLLAYICAQTVNFFVQRKVVFGADGEIQKTLHWYILTVTVAGIISIWLPPHVIDAAEMYLGGTAAMYFANVVNILVQVAVNYPMMKFVVMKKE